MYPAQEFKLVSLRECPGDLILSDTPNGFMEYWNKHIKDSALFNPLVECGYVFLLNSRRKITGHLMVAMGTLDTCWVHPREVFRAAIIGGASAIIFSHNHPSGDVSPSEADIKITKELIRAGQILKLELLDHIIVESTGKTHCSLRQLGHFYI